MDWFPSLAAAGCRSEFYFIYSLAIVHLYIQPLILLWKFHLPKLSAEFHHCKPAPSLKSLLTAEHVTIAIVLLSPEDHII